MALKRSLLTLIPLLALVGGCAHFQRSMSGLSASSSSTGAVVFGEGNASQEKRRLTVAGVELENTDFDIPIVINSQVEMWVDYFTGRGRKHFEIYLARSEFFIPYIQPILSENKMPLDMVYLAMIESGFNNHARSSARAVGPWQFIPGTGKRYGLTYNWWVDERRDIRKSTEAAIQYLKTLYSFFGSWELASAAYNAGEAKIARAIRRYGTMDFWAISRQRFLMPETRNYVPKMMAAAIVSKNRTQFGFAATYLKPGQVEPDVPAEEESLPTVLTENETAESNELNDPNGELSNGALSLAQTPVVDQDRDWESVLKDYESDYEGTGEMPATLIDPTATGSAQFTRNGKPVSGQARFVSTALKPYVKKTGEYGGMEVLEFEVSSPADLQQIARAAGVPYSVVKGLNPEITRWCTPPTEKSYRIKLPASAKEKFLVTYNHPAFPRDIRFRTYKARSGDTVRTIARRFGISPKPIADLNSLGEGSYVAKGKQILLPMPADLTRSIASLEIVDPPTRKRRRGVHRKKTSNRSTAVTLKGR